MAKLQDNLKKIEKYKDASPHYKELLDIYGDILILREKFSRRKEKTVFKLDDRYVEKKLEGGLPLVDLSRENIDLSGPKAYFLELMKIAERINAEETCAIVEDLETGALDFKEMIRETFVQSEADDDNADDSFDLLGFFVEESLRPALEEVAERYAERIRRSRWMEGYCPVCGKEPKIGELRDEDGKRFLFCSQCGTEWNFFRVKCPFCGNEEQKTLSYFTVEEDERYRVDVCDRCKRYIKTIDFRNMPEEPDLDLEDIATIHLDMLANEEGYN